MSNELLLILSLIVIYGSALLAYRLLKDGAAEAKKIVADYQAPYTMDQYKDYVKKMSD